ncbi:MAG: thioredoxin [Chloroflexota bacterium]|nr:thioredoxin [Caldilinea sp.]GIK72415.1 MAG: thioredoxin [Chloroflexota bacterium]
MFDKLKQRFGKANRPVEAAEPPKPPPIIDVTDADFEAVVLRSPLLTVVDFWAEWCQPCQVMSAYVGFLAREYEGRVLVAALDADEHPETPARYNVMGLPTLLLLRDGVEIDRIVGVVGYDEIKTRVERLLANS